MIYAVVGYGSLMSHKSLSDTIPNKGFTPVFVKGYKRICNITLETSSDILNVKKTPKHNCNGVLFFVNKSELKKLQRREDIYIKEKTWCYNFETKEKLCKAYIFVDHHRFIDKYHKNPDYNYLSLCREAAYHISRKFGKFWDNTTYTSSGKKISTWLKSK